MSDPFRAMVRDHPDLVALERADREARIARTRRTVERQVCATWPGRTRWRLAGLAARWRRRLSRPARP